MILNEKQYQITLNQIDSFSKALENIKQKNIGSNRDKYSELE